MQHSPLFPEITVNGEPIPSVAIAAEAQNHVAPKGKPGLAWRSAARALTIRKLLLAEAARRGIVAAPVSVGPGLTETAEEAQIRALLDDAIIVAPPSDAALHEIWAADPDRFRSPPLWQASHILCAAEPSDPKATEAAKARADAVTAALASDPKGFARLARETSDCSSKANGGQLGQLGPGDTVPEFEAALRDLSAGEITKAPVRSRYGWHVIMLESRAEGRVLPFAAVKPRLTEAFEKAAWTRAARDFTEALLADAVIGGIDFQTNH